jgi:mannose-1-phosphate guanylyltransferase/phosphomannomutase
MLDTGAEKVFLVNEKGKVVNDETALALIAALILRSKKDARIAVPVTATRVIEEIANKYHGSVLRTKTTARSIMEQALRKEQDILGDNLGGFIFPHFLGAFDGMFAIAKILELLAKQNVRLHALSEELPPVHIHKERVPCTWSAKGTVMRNLIQLAKDEGEKFELLDGVKIYAKDHWTLLIPDPDKPFFNIYVETEAHSKAKEIFSKYRNKITQWQG